MILLEPEVPCLINHLLWCKHVRYEMASTKKSCKFNEKGYAPGYLWKLSYNYANLNQNTTNYVKMDLQLGDFSGCNKTELLSTHPSGSNCASFCWHQNVLHVKYGEAFVITYLSADSSNGRTTDTNDHISIIRKQLLSKHYYQSRMAKGIRGGNVQAWFFTTSMYTSLCYGRPSYS